MDVESDGHRFYTDPDGNVRLDRVVTPSGEVIERDYGTLPPGRYRFVSSVFLIDEEGNTGCHNDLFHEFVIE
ncbi:MAG: hypothetical protein FWG45_01235 [Oscillospiraceae bacterium]|nr:hypothetical protein [Oscillospiraceae bacterium]